MLRAFGWCLMDDEMFSRGYDDGGEGSQQGG